MDLLNKSVVITGASRGIGADTARVFANAGAKVALLARNRDALADLRNEIGDNAISIACDVSDFDQVNLAIQKTVQTFGRLDVLIGNAGVIEPISRISEAEPQGWGEAIDINLKGIFYGIRAALPIMKKAGSGTIITVSSGAAYGAVEAWSHYCSSKAGALMLTKSLDLEERENGIRSLGLSPGTVATQMQRDIKASGINPVSKLNWEDHIPSEWPARALLWMCSQEADDYLGQDVMLRDDTVRQKIGLI